MSKIIILTDSNSGISQELAKEWGISVLPMPFSVNGEEYLDGIEMSHAEFFEYLAKDADIKTSQPSRYNIEERWDELLSEYDEILYIPTSSGLSKTCENAIVYAEDEKYKGKVHVVDNKRISVTLKQCVTEAIELLKAGKTCQEMKDYLESTGKKNSIYITVNMLKYLKKGGRISPAAAALGSMLNVKPILLSTGDSFDKIGMAMSMGQAKKKMISLVKTQAETTYKKEYEQGKFMVMVGHANVEKEALKFKEEVEKAIPNIKVKFVDIVALSVICHIGPGALALAFSVDDSKSV
ncbi:MAG: DegV family protein [Clostridia bacterium]|nr:DegV family protein [Clostridia bacterium]